MCFQVCGELPRGLQHVRLQRDFVQPRESPQGGDIRHQEGHQVSRVLFSIIQSYRSGSGTFLGYGSGIIVPDPAKKERSDKLKLYL